MPNFYMMVGLPASGKSSRASMIEGVDNIYSSDNLRYELLSNIEDQSHNKEIFDILHSLVKAGIYRGENVVYDATNLHSKRRKEFLESIKLLTCNKICIYMKTPYEVCVERNNNRARKVPQDVIKRMKYGLDEPTMDEGWDEIWEISYSPDDEEVEAL